MLRLLTPADFDAVLRSNLIPGQDRELFDELWMLLAFNDDLAERTFDSLEGWLERADAQLDEGDDLGAPRVRKFRRLCDDAWNRLRKIRDVDVADGPAAPAAHTVAGRFAVAIAGHRQQLEAPTALDEVLWAAVNNARDRARRSRATTKGWQFAPVYTTQLIDAVAEHRRLNHQVRAVDEQLYGLLQD